MKQTKKRKVRDVRFVFVTTRAEREMIKQLARRLQRSEGGTVRLVTLEAARELAIRELGN